MATIRPARAADLHQIDPLIVATINGLTEAHGFGRIASPSAPTFQEFSLADDPDGLWVAESEGAIIGFAFSWVCEDFWFLAQLFVAPDQQATGLGAELLTRTLAHADLRGATKRKLITFAFNRASQGLYLRHGLYPMLPINMMSVQRDCLAMDVLPGGLTVAPMSASDETALADIDKAAVGISRAKHHGYLCQLGNVRGYLMRAGPSAIAYAYVSDDGHIGPVAVLDPSFMDRAFSTAVRIAFETEAPLISAFLPGGRHAALTVAVQSGFRVALPMVVMSDSDLGGWPGYLPRNPGFM